MIKKLASSFSLYLCHELKLDSDRAEILSYGLEVIIGTSLKILSILLFAYALNIFKTTIVSLMSFIIFRRIIGGNHCGTYNKCYLYSNILILFSGFIGSIIYINNLIFGLIFFLNFIFCIVIIFLLVPVGTEKKSIKNEKVRLSIKIKAIITFICWGTFVIFLYNLNLQKLAISSLLGVFLAFFLATFLGKKILKISWFSNLERG